MITSKFDEVDRFEAFSVYNIENILNDLREAYMYLAFDDPDSDFAMRHWRVLDELFERKLEDLQEAAALDYKIESEEKDEEFDSEFRFRLACFLQNATPEELSCLGDGKLPPE